VHQRSHGREADLDLLESQSSSPSALWPLACDRIGGSLRRPAADGPTQARDVPTREASQSLCAVIASCVTRETMTGRARGGRTCSPILIRTTPL
jgi:hypothetical protein